MDEEPGEESAFQHLAAQELEQFIKVEADEEEEKKEAENESQQFVIIQPTDNVID